VASGDEGTVGENAQRRRKQLMNLKTLHKNAAALIKQLQEAEVARNQFVQRSEVEFEERLSDICAPKDAQIDELNKRLAAMEEELKKQLDVNKEAANGLEALRKIVAARSSEIEDLKKRMGEKYAEVEEFKRRTVEFEDGKQILSISKNFLEHEVQRLREQIEASEKLLANATNGTERAIEFAKFLRDEVAGSSFANRKSISTASGGTTVGLTQ
jgi:chromosome segregation ATPase